MHDVVANSSKKVLKIFINLFWNLKFSAVFWAAGDCFKRSASVSVTCCWLELGGVANVQTFTGYRWKKSRSSSINKCSAMAVFPFPEKKRNDWFH